MIKVLVVEAESMVRGKKGARTAKNMAVAGALFQSLDNPKRPSCSGLKGGASIPFALEGI